MKQTAFYYTDENRYNRTMEGVTSILTLLNVNLDKVRSLDDYRDIAPAVVYHLTFNTREHKDQAFAAFKEYLTAKTSKAIAASILNAEWEQFIGVTLLNGYTLKTYSDGSRAWMQTISSGELMAEAEAKNIQQTTNTDPLPYITYDSESGHYIADPAKVKELFDETHRTAQNAKQRDVLALIEEYRQTYADYSKRFAKYGMQPTTDAAKYAHKIMNLK